MPNIASVMKDEIVRLARKEVRQEVEGLKKASAKYRSDIAGLKRALASLEKQVSKCEKGVSLVSKNRGDDQEEASARFRFSAQRFAKQREKMGLTAAEMGTLLEVSPQTVYNWESGKTRPRQQQLAGIAALRKLGKKAVKAQLQFNAPQSPE